MVPMPSQDGLEVARSYHGVKKYRVTWKKTGAAKQMESMRSSTPPCPSIAEPQSFTPRSRLIADIVRPPANPIMQITKAMIVACHQLKGVAHQSAPPSAVAVSTPPMKPSHVLLGLMTGAILCLPRRSPHA